MIIRGGLRGIYNRGNLEMFASFGFVHHGLKALSIVRRGQRGPEEEYHIL